MINNIGVAAEILGMLVFALILLIFGDHQDPSVLFDDRRRRDARDGGYLPVSNT